MTQRQTDGEKIAGDTLYVRQKVARKKTAERRKGMSEEEERESQGQNIRRAVVQHTVSLAGQPTVRRTGWLSRRVVPAYYSHPRRAL